MRPGRAAGCLRPFRLGLRGWRVSICSRPWSVSVVRLRRLRERVAHRPHGNDAACAQGIFPNGGGIIRLIGAIQLEANDEWQLQHRYMQTEPIAELIPALIDATTPEIATVAA